MSNDGICAKGHNASQALISIGHECEAVIAFLK
jgi:hypothetical protein